MRLRYKKGLAEFQSSEFNTHAMSEVLTGDDSAFISELDVCVDGEWLDLRDAFLCKAVVPNNYNTHFGVPVSAEARKLGYNP